MIIDNFSVYDPIHGTIPNHPLPFGSIAARARVLLKIRTDEQIKAALSTAEWAIDNFEEDQEEEYQRDRDRFIQRTIETGQFPMVYLDEAERNESGLRHFLDNWPSEIDDSNPYPSKNPHGNRSDLDCLKDCIGAYIFDDPELPDAKDYEYFAALALRKVADGLDALNPDREKEIQRHLSEKFPGLAERYRQTVGVPETYQRRTQNAAVISLEAMDAVCYAEMLQRTSQLQADITALRAEVIEARNAAATAYKAAANSETVIAELAEQKAREKISLRASRAAIQGHAENHAMKADVFAWCEANLGKKTIDGAASEVAGKIVSVTFRTAQRWISEYRRNMQRASTV